MAKKNIQYASSCAYPSPIQMASSVLYPGMPDDDDVDEGDEWQFFMVTPGTSRRGSPTKKKAKKKEPLKLVATKTARKIVLE